MLFGIIYGGFLKCGYPPNLLLQRDFSWNKPSIWGYPHDYGTPHIMDGLWLWSPHGLRSWIFITIAFTAWERAQAGALRFPGVSENPGGGIIPLRDADPADDLPVYTPGHFFSNCCCFCLLRGYRLIHLVSKESDANRGLIQQFLDGHPPVLVTDFQYLFPFLSYQIHSFFGPNMNRSSTKARWQGGYSLILVYL